MYVNLMCTQTCCEHFKLKLLKSHVCIFFLAYCRFQQKDMILSHLKICWKPSIIMEVSKVLLLLWFQLTTTKIIFSTVRKLIDYSWLVSYSLFITYSLFTIPYSLLIPYSLFLISFDGFQLSLTNTSTTENASRLLIFKSRGQEHGDILSFHI